MTHRRARPLALAVLLATAAALMLPTAAAASASSSMPLALFGIDIAELVEDVIKGLVDLIVPDFAADWASGLITWLVAIPNVNSWTYYPNLNGFRRQLTGVGFGLLGLSFTAAMVWVSFGDTRGLDALKRTATAAIVLVTYPQLTATAITAVNLLTAEAVKNPQVISGIDTALGGALAVAVITSGFSLGLAVAAAIGALYFIAALMIMKIGLTTLQAVAMVAGSLVWGLYPLHGASWLARAWTAGMVVVMLVPVGWAIVFSAFALLSSDALVFSNPGGSGLGAALQNIVKPFAAMACLWIAYKTPAFMLSTARAFGIQPSALVAGGAGAGGARTPGPPSNGRVAQARAALAGGPAGVAKGAISTNADRFRAIGARAAVPARAAAGGVSAAGRRAGARTVVGAGRIAAPVAAQAAIAASLPGSPRAKAAAKATKTAKNVGRTTRRAAGAPKRANELWRALPAETAARRRGRSHRGSPTTPATTPANAPGGPAGPADQPAPATSAASTTGASGASTSSSKLASGSPGSRSSTPTTAAHAAGAAQPSVPRPPASGTRTSGSAARGSSGPSTNRPITTSGRGPTADHTPAPPSSPTPSAHAPGAQATPVPTTRKPPASSPASSSSRPATAPAAAPAAPERHTVTPPPRPPAPTRRPNP